VQWGHFLSGSRSWHWITDNAPSSSPSAMTMKTILTKDSILSGRRFFRTGDSVHYGFNLPQTQ